MSIIRQSFFLFAILLLLATSAWYFNNAFPPVKIDTKTLLTTTDTIITNLKVRQYSASGTLANLLQTPFIKHMPKENTHWIKTPHITITQENQSIWEIDSQQAIAIHGGEKISFNKQVRIHQQKDEHNNESIFTTEQITYFPKTKHAITSKDVLLVQSGNQIQSKGMRADLETKHIQLLSQARGLYDPNHG